ncbi:hypothetical protein [Paraburkholderia kirstenboschensis]|uniref:Uncharacterized protein n=1 Tax=Paraburkholderia kirstenboschensis TaxID=1245436 RepID=A0ABZ0EFP0_9BURK|nr:hypothetical protein [Paraburkholderia kirstenboschensis]WOD16039.1 hypothetical protein RW095_08800 [Paraburkholderia kirstenboschensis]
MNKHFVAAAVAGLFSIAAFAQASAPVAASSQAAVAAPQETKPAVQHHHATKQHKHAHKHAHKHSHHAASAAGGEQNAAPASDEAAPSKP